MILIITNSMDVTADFLETKIQPRGVRVTRLNVDEWRGSGYSTVFQFINGKSAQSIINVISGSVIDLQTISAVWFRRPSLPTIGFELPRNAAVRFAEGEWDHLLNSLYALLSDRFWISDVHKIRKANAKPYQLKVAVDIGFQIPDTLITNSPNAAQSFCNKNNGTIAYKALHGFVDGAMAEPLKTVYTNLVDVSTISHSSAEIESAPCIFQEYIPKQFELRVTVVGTDVHAVAIHSQQSDRSKFDWRRYDLKNTPYVRYDLDREVSDRCIALVRALGLEFGCIDLIVTPDGKLVFLEINPNGEWMWLQTITGVPIAESIVTLLCKHISTREFNYCAG